MRDAAEQALDLELLRIAQGNLARWQSHVEGQPLTKPVYTEAMGAVQCQWCLELFRPVDQQRTPEELGALKTKLMMADRVVPVICDVCYQKQMSDDTFRCNPIYKVNRLLLGY